MLDTKLTMNSSSRLVLELVAHHGNLSVPDLRTLTRVCKDLVAIRDILASKKQHESETHSSADLITEYTYYLSSFGLKIKHGTSKTFYRLGSGQKTPRRASHEIAPRLHSWETFVDGAIDGTAWYWYQNGKLRQKTTYELGKEIVSIHMNMDGTLYRATTWEWKFDEEKARTSVDWYWNWDSATISRHDFKLCENVECEGVLWRQQGKRRCIDINSDEGKGLTAWAMEMVKDEK